MRVEASPERLPGRLNTACASKIGGLKHILRKGNGGVCGESTLRRAIADVFRPRFTRLLRSTVPLNAWSGKWTRPAGNAHPAEAAATAHEHAEPDVGAPLWTSSHRRRSDAGSGNQNPEAREPAH